MSDSHLPRPGTRVRIRRVFGEQAADDPAEYDRYARDILVVREVMTAARLPLLVSLESQLGDGGIWVGPDRVLELIDLDQCDYDHYPECKSLRDWLREKQEKTTDHFCGRSSEYGDGMRHTLEGVERKLVEMVAQASITRRDQQWRQAVDDKPAASSLQEKPGETHLRELLDTDPWARRQAICTFILSTAQIANDLQSLVAINQRQPFPPEMESSVQFVEDQIRNCYRCLLGREMGR